MRVGFVGLGRMGATMAQRLLAAGHQLTVANRSQAIVAQLAAEGAAPARTPAEVATASEIVLACLTDPPASEQVFLGGQGLLPAARPGQVFVDLGTHISLLLKDLNLIDDLAGATGVRLLGAAVAKQAFAEATALDLAGQDIAALVQPLERIAGITVGGERARSPAP